jgi:hypothetical protein
MYKCKHFKLHELVDPTTYKVKGETAWELLDSRLLITLDRMRDKYGRMTINNWFWDGEREWSGLRTPDSPYYSTYSQHTYGRAADIIFADYTAEQVRQDIVQSINHTHRIDKIYEYITAVELNVNWLHFDVRNCQQLKTFNS